jgi:hypothetical protein
VELTVEQRRRRLFGLIPVKRHGSGARGWWRASPIKEGGALCSGMDGTTQRSHRGEGSISAVEAAFSRRRERKGGSGLARGQVEEEEGGGLAMARARAGGPRHERRAVGRRQLGDGGAGSRAWEAGEEREGRERGRLVGGPARRVGPTCQRSKERGGENDRWAPGCG